MVITNEQLTKNFSVKEIIGGNKDWKKYADKTQNMIFAMANMLQFIRDIYERPVRISSGLRDISDYERMKNNGLNPSPTSDHFYGQDIGCIKGSAAEKKYGAIYKLSVGAADFTVDGFDIIKVYNDLLKYKYDKVLKCGQLLLEKNNSYWIHIANDPTSFLTDEEKKLRGEISLNGNGYSLDNGKSFDWISPGKFLPSTIK